MITLLIAYWAFSVICLFTVFKFNDDIKGGYVDLNATIKMIFIYAPAFNTLFMLIVLVEYIQSKLVNVKAS
jgi:hypothetical protein